MRMPETLEILDGTTGGAPATDKPKGWQATMLAPEEIALPQAVDTTSTTPSLETIFHQSCPDNKLSFGKYLEIRAAFEAAGLGTINYCTNRSETIPAELQSQIQVTPRFSDREGNQSAFNISIKARDPHPVLVLAKQLDILAGLSGGGSSGTDNFGSPKINYGTDLILHVENPGILCVKNKNQHDVRQIEAQKTQPPLWYPKHGEFQISPDGKTIFAGRGISSSLVSYLASTNGGRRIIPADHTTKDQDDHTASYMTGAQGPRRLRPSSYIKRVLCSNGEEILEFTDPKEIEEYEGTLGLHLTVLAIEYYTFEVPKNNFALVVPLNVTNADPSAEEGNWASEQGALNGHLEFTFARINQEAGKLESSWENGFLNGAEVATASDIDNAERYSPKTDKTQMAQAFKNQMEGKDGQKDSVYALYLTGSSHEDPEELLVNAIIKYGAFKEFGYTAEECGEEEPPKDRTIPYPTSHDPFEILVYLTVKGQIRAPRLFTKRTDLEACEELREGMPSAAKAEIDQAKKTPGLVAESKSTDSNTGLSQKAWKRLEALNPADAANELICLNRLQLQATLNFDIALQRIASELHALQKINTLARRVQFKVYHYGHRNDPHERYTVIGDTNGLEATAAAEVTAITQQFAAKAKKATDDLTHEQLALPHEHPELVIERGEKGRIPHHKFLSPTEADWLKDQFERDPHNTARLLGWRIKGTPQEAVFAAHSSVIQAMAA